MALIDRLTETSDHRSTLGGSQGGVRQYNERLILQLIRRAGALPKAEIARMTSLTPQTISVIINRLIAEGLLAKGKRQKGKVGQPSVPIAINPSGAYAIGVKVGRRSTEVQLIDFSGDTLANEEVVYDFPTVEVVFDFLRRKVAQFAQHPEIDSPERLYGVGVAMPFGLGDWVEELNAPHEEAQAWQDLDVEKALSEATALPTWLMNDATTACVSEIVFGQALEHSNSLYFFVGTFIGGGVILNGQLFEGTSRNAGALGSMPVCLADDASPKQLIQLASRLQLEQMLSKAGFTPEKELLAPVPCAEALAIIDQWIEQAARAIAYACVSALSVIDFGGVVIDGAFSRALVGRLCHAVESALQVMNTQGLTRPHILVGSIGPKARVIGASILPLYSNFAPDRDVLLKVADFAA